MSFVEAKKTETVRDIICENYLAVETDVTNSLIAYLDLTDSERDQIVDDATEFVRMLRRNTEPGIMETFLGEYGLSTEEGVALMCLAEALLRVPDEDTIDALIRDKIAPANWSKHLGHSTSPLVNASTWALMLTGKVISPEETASWDVVANVRHLIRRAGEPVIRKAVAQSMKVLGHQFVLGRNIKEAMSRAKNMEDQGYQYSYDMLGEAARTAADASKYFLSYSKAISELADAAVHEAAHDNPGISVKLSALHPRYEFSQKQRVMDELVPRVASLAMQAKNAGMGFNIDAEEADRLDLSLDVIEAVLSIPDLAGWDGFGVVIQAYSPRAFYVIDWCYGLAQSLDRKIMIRLVKGAYWDTEIKLAQVEGLSAYPVFTQKAATDISYMACAKKLLSMTDRIYPQFATHNAHTVTAVLALAKEGQPFEFQRLHGMGEALHALAKKNFGCRCRIYAPVGIHEDLLAYLVRRLLENGANSSFVNQVFDEKVPARHVVEDPVNILRAQKSTFSLPLPVDIYPNGRKNSAGINFANPANLSEFYGRLDAAADTPMEGGDSDPAQIDQAMQIAKGASAGWQSLTADGRAEILLKIADLYEESRDVLMKTLIVEAGKTPFDALNEVREAIDFCRYYAEQARTLNPAHGIACGVFVCISPWNFPLAIFTGQIVAALVTGNAVLAKPAEQTPLIAGQAVSLMHRAGIPEDVLHLLLGTGADVGQILVSHPGVDGICFTGSTITAQKIHTALVEHGNPSAPLIAETGGLNAMIVDSTALPEQVVGDIVASAFQSAGQRCSALRILYVQEEIADNLSTMLQGAMDELIVGNSYEITTDVGPVIDEKAKVTIDTYVEQMAEKGAIIKKMTVPSAVENQGYYIAPTLIHVSGIEEMDKEIFGPVLHLATYPSGGIKTVLKAINAAGYGLTLGLHTRVDNRVEEVAAAAQVGNLYVNRNQIGAVVGSQPFGGEGLSGTGPKAGGPLYLHKFLQSSKALVRSTEETVKAIFSASDATDLDTQFSSLKFAQAKWEICADRIEIMQSVISHFAGLKAVDIEKLQGRITGYYREAQQCASPTGERNLLTFHGRGLIWIAGLNWLEDTLISLLSGNGVLLSKSDETSDELIAVLAQFGATKGIVTYANATQEILRNNLLDGVCISSADTTDLRYVRQKLADRSGKIISSLQSGKSWREFVQERCLSVDTTASGGNAALLAEVNR
ncbi:MAG: L-glutamate gamma-semialdehyde dehydrogenase [Pseudomonas marincola]